MREIGKSRQDDNSADAFVELARQLRLGRRNVASAMLEEMDPTRRNPEFAMDLIYREFLVLQQLGEQPDVAAFCQRFPEHETRLRRLLEVDLAIGASVDEYTVDGEPGDTINETLPYEKQFGRYVLMHQIGQGGSSRVYKARQTDLDRFVAIKMLNPSAIDSHHEHRFQQEAELISRLQHPNIVQLHDYGMTDEQPFHVLELVDGGSLDHQTENAMPDTTIVPLMIKLARAVQFAHDNQVIHRDLKPSNILLTRTGEPKIADFGLAKNLRPLNSDFPTETGTTLGTPSFMAPEQVSAGLERPGPATDVYGLGTVLYQMLTGRAPFVAGNVVETLRQVREQEPIPPSRLRAGLSRDLEVICLRCLNKDPSKRFQSAAALRDELERFQDGHPIRSSAAGRIEKSLRWCRRRPLVASLYVALTAAILLGVLGVGWQWREARSQARVARQEKEDSEKHLQDARQAIENLTRMSLSLSNVPGTHDVQQAALREVLAFYARNTELVQDDERGRHELARTYSRMATIYSQLIQSQNAIDNYDSAFAEYQKLTVDYPGKPKYMFGQAECLFDLGISHQSLGDFEKATECFLKAASFYEVIEERDPDDNSKVRLAIALVNAANMMPYPDDQGRAEDLCRQAIEIFERCDNKSSSFFGLNYALSIEQLGKVLVTQGNFQESTIRFQAVVDLLESHLDTTVSKNAISLGRNYRQLAEALFEVNSDSDDWIGPMQKAAEVMQSSDIGVSEPRRRACLATIVESSATLYWLIGDLQQAESNFAEALEIFETLDEEFDDQDHAVARAIRILATCPVESVRDPVLARAYREIGVRRWPGSSNIERASALVDALYGPPAENVQHAKASNTRYEELFGPRIQKGLWLLSEHRTDTVVDEETGLPAALPGSIAEKLILRRISELLKE